MKSRRLARIGTCALLLLTGAAAVGQPSSASPPGTAVLAAAGTALHFTAAGDFGANTQTSAVLNGIRSVGPDLSLALGDLSYGSTATEKTWCDFVTARVGSTLPFELITGNHESNGLDGNIDAFASCLPNRLPGLVGTYGKQWYVDVPAADPVARFVMISPGLNFPDGTWSYDAGTTRYAWTASAIDGARASGIPWVVVGFHVPCFSMTARQCGSGPDLMNLLVSKKVDLVLSGHNHIYERTKQLSHSASCTTIRPGTTSAACIADADATLTQGKGTVFATVGTGGTALQSLNTADSERPYFAAWAGPGANPTWGFLDVTADNTRLSATFHRTGGGTFTDSFAISRPASAPRFVGASHSASGATKYKQVTVPSAAQPGDSMLMFLTRNTAAGWSGPSGVTGWTRVSSVVQGPVESTLWKKSVTSADIGAAVRVDATRFAKGVLSLAVYSGVDLSRVVSGSIAAVGDAQTAAHHSPTATTGIGDLALSYWADKSAGTTSWVPPSGPVVRDSSVDVGAGRFGSLLADSGAGVPGGSYGGLVARTNAVSSQAVAWTVPLPPVP